MVGKIESQTYETSERPGRYCIPGVHNSQLTLCGFVDVPYTAHEATDHPCNCVDCMDALTAIRRLRFARNYFANNSSSLRDSE
jgi:pyrrolidone-carboxylate peptidase